MLHKFQNIPTFSLNGRRVDLDLEDAHREVCPPVCRVQVVLSIIRHIQVRPEYYFVIQYYLLLRLLIFTIIDYCIIRHVQVRPESMNILWNKGGSHQKKLLFFWILSKLQIQNYRYNDDDTLANRKF